MYIVCTVNIYSIGRINYAGDGRNAFFFGGGLGEGWLYTYNMKSGLLTVLTWTCTCLQCYLLYCIPLQESTSLSDADHTEQTVHHSGQCVTGPQYWPEVYCGAFLRDLSTCTGISVVMETPTDLI